MRRRDLILALPATLLAAPLHARAATVAAFDPAAFAAAQAEGKSIVVDIWASWCPTCAKQQPILSQLEADPAFADLLVFRVDFDAQKPIVAGLGARMQSTLIAFHGKTETARAVGITDAAAIRSLFASAKA